MTCATAPLAGSAFQFRIMQGLASAFRLYAVDHLGTGLSGEARPRAVALRARRRACAPTHPPTRAPRLPPPTQPPTAARAGRPPFRARSTEEAEAFFVDSLAKWREAAGLGDEKMVLMGHSLGGYLSGVCVCDVCCDVSAPGSVRPHAHTHAHLPPARSPAVYALRHPEHVKHLILVCPAGVGRQPADWKPPVRTDWSLRGVLFRAATSMWNSGATPGVLVRWLGPWGPGLVGRYARTRFQQGHHLSEEEVERFERYMYSILALPGSGEFALRHLLVRRGGVEGEGGGAQMARGIALPVARPNPSPQCTRRRPLPGRAKRWRTGCMSSRCPSPSSVSGWRGGGCVQGLEGAARGGI